VEHLVHLIAVFKGPVTQFYLFPFSSSPSEKRPWIISLKKASRFTPFTYCDGGGGGEGSRSAGVGCGGGRDTSSSPSDPIDGNITSNGRRLGSGIAGVYVRAGPEAGR
jgi:hypothetical protein